ncbi:hypothetical protein APA_1383 [Pseudanabaena sp. lw0831]|nr:hypothetical protein APA_1383 [Pseudanabaena sp. lw0831]
MPHSVTVHIQSFKSGFAVPLALQIIQTITQGKKYAYYS